MLKNYFTTAINNLLKNKLYSVINIVGLAVGLSAFILLTLYVSDELSYDRGWEKADLIYRVNNKLDFVPSLRNAFPFTSPLLLPALKKDFPDEIEMGARTYLESGEIKIGDTYYPGEISFVDKDFINMFQCEIVSGNLEKTFLSPGNIALDEKTAARYFGAQDPIGKVITQIQHDGKQKLYKVTAVYRFISPNTVFDISSLSLLEVEESQRGADAWFALGYQTFIRFNESADIEGFVNRLPDFINRNIPTDKGLQLDPGTKMSDIRSYPVQKMKDIYFDPLDGILGNHSLKKGNRTVIIVFIVISLLVLIIASINFIILTTARATQRAKEVALRKVVGARFKQLLFQFLGESILITLVAFIIAIALTELALPAFEAIVSKDLAVPYFSPISYLISIMLLLSVGLLGGLYPAFVLSRFAPNRALKANKTTEADGSVILKKILVIFQFAASIALIAATITAFCQLQYTYKHDPGYNPENLLVLEGLSRPDIAQYRNTLKQELMKQPDVTNVCLSSIQPKMVGAVSAALFSLRRKTDGSIPQHDQIFPNMQVDYDFFQTYEIPILSGRNFIPGTDQEETQPAPEAPPEDNIKPAKNSMILNLEAAKRFGFTSAADAVGKFLETGSPDEPNYREFKIIGVVADSQFRDLRAKPEPELYQLSPDATNYLTVKYQGDYQNMVNKVSQVWKNVVGDVLFKDNNVKQNLTTTFSQEKQENRAFIAFALLSIFIAGMGLFGMASFTVDRRVKEIGLRKVLGAKITDIVRLLVWQFLKPVLIANIIAWPIAIFAMQHWLERFPYRFNSMYMIPICLVSGLIALTIAWFTVAGNTTRVAKSKPIKALRYE